MILDSNLVIYAAEPGYPGLRRLIASSSPSVSAVSLVEVLGHHRLDAANKTALEDVFATARILPIDDAVVAGAVSLRQARKMSLGDALIAATALRHSLPLWTNNAKDFAGIPGLVVVNPLAHGDPTGASSP